VVLFRCSCRRLLLLLLLLLLGVIITRRSVLPFPRGAADVEGSAAAVQRRRLDVALFIGPPLRRSPLPILLFLLLPRV
jgi:hypothetical protein